jgi:hypothetical protein
MFTGSIKVERLIILAMPDSLFEKIFQLQSIIYNIIWPFNQPQLFWIISPGLSLPGDIPRPPSPDL